MEENGWKILKDVFDVLVFIVEHPLTALYVILSFIGLIVLRVLFDIPIWPKRLPPTSSPNYQPPAIETPQQKRYWKKINIGLCVLLSICIGFFIYIFIKRIVQA